MILIYERGGVLRVVEFDATTRRNHLGTNTPAQHPVQDEPDRTDNGHAEPVRLSAECVVSNTPVADSIGDVIGTRGPVTVDATTRELISGAKVSGGAQRQPPVRIPFVRTGTEAEVSAAEWRERSISLAAQTLQFPQPFNRVRDVYEELDALRRNSTRVQVVTAIKTYDAMMITSLGAPEEAKDAIKFQLELQEVFTGTATLVDAPVPLERRAEKPKAQGAQATYALPEQQKSVLKQGLEKLAALAANSGVL